MSTDAPLFADQWYRVKRLRPRLAEDVRMKSHQYRGQRWWVLQRRSNSKLHRVDDETFRLLELLDGETPVEALWERSLQLHGEDAASQDDIITLLAQLYEADLLISDRKLNAEQLFVRRNEQRSRDRKERFLNPLFMRFSLLDPDDWLQRNQRLWLPLTEAPAKIAWWVLLLGTGVVLLPQWQQLKATLAGFDPFAPHNVMLYLIVFPILKLVHELAHGVMVKKSGGEVHDLGLALMVLLPIPYVDASAAAIHPDKKVRIRVGAAGIYVELFFAAVGGLLWAATQPGFLNDLGLVLFLIGGVSSLFFNGNPLLKFDAYYILADWLEIPNLAERANQYWRQLAKQALFNQTTDTPTFADRREALWIASYGITSSLYRIVLMLGIAYFLSGAYFFFGVLLAGWVCVMMFGKPMYEFAKFLYVSRQNAQAGVIRGVALTGVGVICVAVLLGVVQWPTRISTQGVVWLPEEAIVRAPHDCEVRHVTPAPLSQVTAASPLLECANPELTARLAKYAAQVDELEAKRAGLNLGDRVQEQLLTHEIRSVKEEMAHVRTTLDALSLRAIIAGRFVPNGDVETIGQFLQQGDIAAFVVPPNTRTIRLALAESEALTDVREIALRTADGATYTTQITRQAPRATYTVPSIALTTEGGGLHRQDPNGDGTKVMEPVVDVELAWPPQAAPLRVGHHVDVVLVGRSQTIANRVVDNLRRAFLGHLSS